MRNYDIPTRAPVNRIYDAPPFQTPPLSFSEDVTVETIAELKEMVGANYAGLAVRVLGTDAKGDGGGAVYYFDAASTATPDDVLVIEPDTGPGRWLIAPSVPGSVQTITSPALKALTTCYCLGNSLTAGEGGVPWLVRFSELTGLTMVNEGIGGETSTQIRARFDAAPDSHASLAIFQACENNFNDGTTVKADIAAMVAALGHDRYLVIGVINGANEPEGSAEHTTKVALNSQLAAIYGERFVDIRTWLIENYDPEDEDDVEDHDNDVPPSSLRSDLIHLNTAGYALVADKLFTQSSVLTASAESLKLITAEVLRAFLASPTPLGNVAPSDIFTTILHLGASLLVYPSGDGTAGQIAGDWLPDGMSTRNLGSDGGTGFFWNRAFLTQLDFPGATGQPTNKIYSSGDKTGLHINVPLYPVSNGVGNLGSDILYFAIVFANILQSADLRFKANTNVRVEAGAGSPEGSLYRDYGSSYQDYTNGLAWTKRTSVTLNTGWESNSADPRLQTILAENGVEWNGTASGGVSSAIASVGTGDFTVCCIINPISFTGFPRVIGQNSSAVETLLAFNSSGLLVSYDGAATVFSDRAVPTNRPSMVTATRASGVVSFYINKALCGGGAMAGSIGTQDRIGGDSEYFINGSFARVLVYNQASNAAKVADIYDAGCLPKPSESSNVIYSLDDASRYTQAAAVSTGIKDVSGNGCVLTLPGSGAAKIIRPAI